MRKYAPNLGPQLGSIIGQVNKVGSPKSKVSGADQGTPEVASSQEAATGHEFQSLVLRCSSSVALSPVAYALGRSSPKNTLPRVFKKMRQAAISTRFKRLRRRFADLQ